MIPLLKTKIGCYNMTTHAPYHKKKKLPQTLILRQPHFYLHIYKMDHQQYFEANKEGWNKRTLVHKDSSFYDVASFKAGRSSLNKIELEELGNVKEKTLLHLQCHFGMDTLSWAREGAIVTG